MCRWKIQPTGGMPLTFQFTLFATSDSMDIVKIIDLQTQEILGVFSGSQLPPQVTAQNGKMLVLFTTNSKGNAQGWAGNYFTSGVGISEPDSCQYQTVAYPNPTTGHITLQGYFYNTPEITIRLLDSKGATVFIKKYKTANGKNIIPINLGLLDAATYSMNIEGKRLNESIKVVVKQ
jgi:hypothetical protein